MADHIQKKHKLWWDCICGRRVKLSDELAEGGKQYCPKCGTPVGDPALVTAADTQMVNIEEMARIAQEGIEVGVSGEWDTAQNKIVDRSKRKKK
ncbi:MAG TPA: hypothetical protein VK463_02640 [Desulfomonilaceae bacterium]|nr:hypothetical protein [Desulfomonilaceae bacterium]